MPDVAQYPETIRDSAQGDRKEPRGDDQQRDRRDVDTEQVDLVERQTPSPASKYAPCWTRASETRSTIARVRSARKACGPDSASAARRRSSSAKRAVAAALCPCAKPASAASSSAPTPSCGAIRRRLITSLPTESAVMICERCSGSAASGNAAIRACMRLSQSSRAHRAGCVARRRRSRKLSASRRRVRKVGESGGNRRNDSAPATEPAAIARAEL